MTNAPDISRDVLLDCIKADRAAGMDPKHGSWIWHGQPDCLSLATANGGRRYVMDFVRKGMRGAQPRFQSGGLMHGAADSLVSFSVGDDRVRGDAMAKMNTTVYRYDVSGIDHPDARRIARVPEMESRILEDAATLRAQAARIAELEAALARLRQDRPFIVGFNEGYKMGVEQAVDVFDYKWRENSATKRAAILSLLAKDTSHDG